MVKRIIIAVTGATGAIYALRMLQMLRKIESIETHLIISDAGKISISCELDQKVDDFIGLSDVYYNIKDISAEIASGSAEVEGMIIVPCSIKTMSQIASGMTSNLIARVADVQLKERVKLVMMVRETPLHAGHLRNMAQLSDLGAYIYPPMPAFYTKPQNLEEVIDQTVLRVFKYFNIPELNEQIERWKGVSRKKK